MPLQYNRDKSDKPSNGKGLEVFWAVFFTLFQVKKSRKEANHTTENESWHYIHSRFFAALLRQPLHSSWCKAVLGMVVEFTFNLFFAL